MTTFTEFLEAKPAKNEAKALVHKYTELLCEALIENFKSRNNGKTDGYKFYIESGNKYHKVVMETGGGNRSVHCFINKTTGDVLKSASWKSPAKGVRYNLLDEYSREACYDDCDWSGSYLYYKY